MPQHRSRAAKPSRAPRRKTADSSGRGPRGSRLEMKEAVLSAAKEVFSEDGFQQATIKRIADRAGVDSRLVHYYFGSKSRLFTACLTDMVESMQILPAARNRLDSGKPFGEFYVCTVLSFIENDSTGPLLIGLLRSVGTHKESRRLFLSFMATVVVPRLTGMDAGTVESFFDVDAARAGSLSDDTISGMMLVGSQMIGLLLARYVIKVPALAQAPIDDIAQRIGPVVDYYLGIAPSPGASSARA